MINLESLNFKNIIINICNKVPSVLGPNFFTFNLLKWSKSLANLTLGLQKSKYLI